MPARAGTVEGMRGEPNHLGDYLRARRALVTPEQAGVPASAGRRVPGLRREEVALLAGISADYYLRLERGRDRNPSEQVLAAIAGVLRLGDEGRAHLLALAAAKPRRPLPRAEVVPDSVVKLLPAFAGPAFVQGRYFDVLAANEPAVAFSPRWSAGRNQLLDVFLDPAEAALHPDWDGTTACYVSSLRRSIGSGTDDPRFVALVEELTTSSPRFRDLWSRHDVSTQRGTSLRLDHPRVGALRLHRDRLDVSGTDGLHLVVLHPEPGSRDAEKLAELRPTRGAPAPWAASASWS